MQAYSKLKESQANTVKKRYKLVICKNKPKKKLVSSQNLINIGIEFVCRILQATASKKFKASATAAINKFSCTDSSTIFIILRY